MAIVYRQRVSDKLFAKEECRRQVPEKVATDLEFRHT